jgi:hypothetical protein
MRVKFIKGGNGLLSEEREGERKRRERKKERERSTNECILLA